MSRPQRAYFIIWEYGRPYHGRAGFASGEPLFVFAIWKWNLHVEVLPPEFKSWMWWTNSRRSTNGRWRDWLNVSSTQKEPGCELSKKD